MKKLLHGLVFMSVFYSFSIFAQSPDMGIGKFDTITSKTWENDNWVTVSRLYNNYNLDCNISTSTSQTRLNNAWNNASRSTYTYLPSKKVDQSFSYFWDDPNWVLIGRTTNTYNLQLQLTKELSESYVGSTWMGRNQNLLDYDANGYLSEELSQTWIVDQFQNSYKTNYVNTAGGLVVSERTQNWAGASWQNQDSTYYTYNGMNQIKMAMYYDWIENQWVNTSRSTGTYVNNLLTQILDEDWVNNDWVNAYRESMTYDGVGRLITQLSQNWDADNQIWVNELLNEISYTSECGALPLTLLNFEASNSSGEIDLEWKTTNEINTSRFEIERSTDGIEFKTIGTVQAKGGQLINNYSYQDKIESGAYSVLYYRLRMKDSDGKFSLSNVAKVNVDTRGKLSLFPNPVRNQLIFTTGVSMKNVGISITGQDGKTVFNQRMGDIQEGTKNTIDVSNLPAGVYILRIIDNSRVVSKTFLKQ